METSENAAMELRRIEQFLYYEGRLLDEHRYEEWEQLWTDDALYWVPAEEESPDPNQKISYVYDNRGRIKTRVLQLLTGDRHAQIPRSRTQRYISNVEILESDQGEALIQSALLVVESRFGEITLWPGKATHRLREVEGELTLAMKKVVLVNNDLPITSMAFLL